MLDDAPLLGGCVPRAWELGVVRGLAALIVVLHHFCLGLAWPLGAGGDFCVAIFFVLSGQVLAWRFLHEGNGKELLMSSLWRVPRLLLPALFACLLECVLANLGAFRLAEAAQKLSGSPWCGGGRGGVCWTANFWEALRDGVKPLWTFEASASVAVLWTLSCEILGSCFIYIFAPLALTVARPPATGDDKYFKGSALPVKTRCFALHSMMLFLLELASQCERLRPERFIGLLGGWYHHGEGDHQVWRVLFYFETGLAMAHLRALGILRMDQKLFAVQGSEAIDRRKVLFSKQWLCVATIVVAGWLVGLAGYHSVGAPILITGVVILPDEVRQSSKNLRLLGDLAFSMYLLHMMVLQSVAMPLYLVVKPAMSQFPAFVLCTAVGMLTLFGVSYAFWKLVDEPVVRRAPLQLCKHLLKSLSI